MKMNERGEGEVKIEKGSIGYIKNNIKKNLLLTFIWIIIGFGIFVIGMYLNNFNRANILTVLAVLAVLPAAKRIVALVVFLPRKGITEERKERIQENLGGGKMICEYVFTSTEKIVHLDFLLIKNGNVMGVVGKSKQDEKYLEKYLKELVKKKSEYPVYLFKNDQELIEFSEKLDDAENDLDANEELAEYLLTFAV